jgi:hypothetical protein
MSPSVITSPVRNFKFPTEGSLGRTRNYQLREKELFALENRFPEQSSSMRGSSGFQLADEPSSGDLIRFGPIRTKVLLVVGCPDPRLRVDRTNSTHCPTMVRRQFCRPGFAVAERAERRHLEKGDCKSLSSIKGAADALHLRSVFHVDNALALFQTFPQKVLAGALCSRAHSPCRTGPSRLPSTPSNPSEP